MQTNDEEIRAIHRAEAAKRLIAVQPVGSANASASLVSEPVSPRYPGIVISQISKAQAFEIISGVRKRIAVKEISNGTEKDYRNKAAHLLSLMDASDEPCEATRWSQGLDAYAGQASSFRSNKAAACWHLRQSLTELLRRQDRMQRTGDFGSNWLQCIEHIVDLAQVYETVYGYTRQLPLVVEGLRLPEKESKGDDLKVIARKFPDWMQRMHEGAAGTKYVDALHVLELIGCRPEELKHGVTITQTDPHTATFMVHGAKVTEHAGQPWRKISLPLSRLKAEWIDRLRANGSLIIKIASKEGLRNSLQRISSRVLKGARFATAYVYRHAMATMLRDAGRSVEEIAAILGHSVAETQQLYGFRKGGGRKKMLARDTGYKVEVAREVRVKSSYGVKMIPFKVASKLRGP